MPAPRFWRQGRRCVRHLCRRLAQPPALHRSECSTRAQSHRHVSGWTAIDRPCRIHRAQHPAAMAGAARYRAQLQLARLAAGSPGAPDWALVFQSRSGRPEDPWLFELAVRSYLRAERERGLEAAVICPIGFICDHIEVSVRPGRGSRPGLPRSGVAHGASRHGERRPDVSRDDGRRGAEDLGIAIARVFRWAWPSTVVKPSGRGLPARACRSPAEGLRRSRVKRRERE